jgi:hypothetical protein
MRAANYVEETTTSIAGTSGDGAVTLTAITNVPLLSSVMGKQETTLSYVIEDTVGKKFETGIGSVASNVLTRTRPQVTWDGSAYSDNAPAALQFGSSPTSGNIRVRMAATAESQGVVMAGTNASVGSNAWRDYPWSGHLTRNSNLGQGMNLTANREYYAPYRLDKAGRLTGIQCGVITAVGSSTMSVALYSLGDTGLPTQKIVDFNSVDTGTTGVKTDTTTGTWSPAGAVWLTPGWYCIGFISSHAISINRANAVGTMQPTPFGRSDVYGDGDIVYAAGSGTTLPANPAPTVLQTVGTANASMPIFGLRVQP